MKTNAADDQFFGELTEHLAKAEMVSAKCQALLREAEQGHVQALAQESAIRAAVEAYLGARAESGAINPAYQDDPEHLPQGKADR